MHKQHVKFVQKVLKAEGLYNGLIDGIVGPKTRSALSHYEELEKFDRYQHLITAFIQFYALEEGIDAGPIDGLWGSQTQYAYDELSDLWEKGRREEAWRPDDIDKRRSVVWPKQYSPAFEELFGERGASLVRAELPYPHRLSWDLNTELDSFSCHEKVKESIEKVLNRVFNHYGIEQIRQLRLDVWGGCFNNRKIRGGDNWSTHSWGIALDYDPANNRLKWGREKASFAKAEYEFWWEFWEEEGWVSLGRLRNFDWMHIQAAEL